MTTQPRRQRINRTLLRGLPVATEHVIPADVPRKMGDQQSFDFSSLGLPADVSRALAQAFWSQVGARCKGTMGQYWHNIKVFSRFAAETRAVGGLSDIGSTLMVRYIEWLGKQRSHDGEPWCKGTRSAAFSALQRMLRWLQRCRPGLLGEIEYPINPFPWRKRDARRFGKLSVPELRAVLKACERDITESRALRDEAAREIAASRSSATSTLTRGDLLRCIDEIYGGVVPRRTVIKASGNSRLHQAFVKYGHIRRIEPCLYPRAAVLFPYYLAILVHSAGNPQALVTLTTDCLQPIPLLDDRELLVWTKGRAGIEQRRSFRSANSFEPPALVREIIQWTSRLRPHAAESHRSRLFLYRGQDGIMVLAPDMIEDLHHAFVDRHHLPYFKLASIRPSVLTSFYRALGDLRQVSAIANHAHLSTTIMYVEGAEVDAQNRARMAAIQSAFVGHVEHPRSAKAERAYQSSVPISTPPEGPAVSMFGFNCKDAFSGIAPGTHQGELCTNFLGCFTCPNAVITAEAASIARLLQARDHLREASGYLHPARWEAIYNPQLRILEEDILTRFSARELAAAAPLRSNLRPLPELR